MMGRVTELERGGHAVGPRLNISLLEKYDGASKQLADQFISQVEAAAEFERFHNERQKVLWAQSYLSGLALTWSCVIMTGVDNPTLNHRRFLWTAWLEDF